MTEKQLLAIYRRKLNTYTSHLHNALIVLMDTLNMSVEEFEGYCKSELGISKNAFDELIHNS